MSGDGAGVAESLKPAHQRVQLRVRFSVRSFLHIPNAEREKRNAKRKPYGAAGVIIRGIKHHRKQHAAQFRFLGT